MNNMNKKIIKIREQLGMSRKKIDSYLNSTRDLSINGHDLFVYSNNFSESKSKALISKSLGICPICLNNLFDINQQGNYIFIGKDIILKEKEHSYQACICQNCHKNKVKTQISDSKLLDILVNNKQLFIKELKRRKDGEYLNYKSLLKLEEELKVGNNE